MHRVTISCYLQLCFEVASVFNGPGDRWSRGVIHYCSLFEEHKRRAFWIFLFFFFSQSQDLLEIWLLISKACPVRKGYQIGGLGRAIDSVVLYQVDTCCFVPSHRKWATSTESYWNWIQLTWARAALPAYSSQWASCFWSTPWWLSARRRSPRLSGCVGGQSFPQTWSDGLNSLSKFWVETSYS